MFRLKFMLRKYLLLILFSSPFLSTGQTTSWPATNVEMYPGTRWWWLGSAVDKVNLTYNLDEYARAGMGTVEITPIYGVQNNDSNNIDFLSAQWMGMLKHTISETKRLGIQTDMNTGTGWSFGGPEVTMEDAASKLVIREYEVSGNQLFIKKIEPEEKAQQSVAKLQRLMAFQNNKVLNITEFVDSAGKISWKIPKGDWQLIAIFNGKTLQKVKRAAPGGVGYVMDHFSKRAVANYLNRFEKAFEGTHTPYPHNFFNDSYEVYAADWTEDFLDQFLARRGYKLENYLPAFLSKDRTDITMRLVSDYRETISELLLENFTKQWTGWAHKHGSQTRNQAHGSPGNLIDLYATVDIPECESFGISDFDIKGLRKDSLSRSNDAELSMLKYASSAAHIVGKQYVSSETCTWLTEHFRTSLSQCKPDIDLMFVSGVNHCYFHGTPYSPKQAKWPGWLFYATTNMSPTNTIWHDAPALFSYITRCQSFLQMGKPDNDFLVYLPIYDVWHEQSGRLIQFDVHSMGKKMPQFINAVRSIYECGYDMDYISDHFILSTHCKNGKLLTESGSMFEALILPSVKKMHLNVLEHIIHLIEQGAKVVFMENFPNDVPGFDRLKSRRLTLKQLLKKLNANTDFNKVSVRKLNKGIIVSGSNYKEALQAIGKQSEELITKFGLHAIRRSNVDGYHYFIISLQNKDIDAWVTLSVCAKSAEFYDPLTGENAKAKLRQREGLTQVYLQLSSGASLILKTFTNANVNIPAWKYLSGINRVTYLNQGWTLHFEESEPKIEGRFTLLKLGSWTELNEPALSKNRGVGIYNTTFRIDSLGADEWILDLGDVRESAQVLVNGRMVGTLWSVPFTCNIRKYLRIGSNTLQVMVTNLPANAIADLDRNKANWRIFNEINMVDINYSNKTYETWGVVPSGLLGPVKLKLQALKYDF